MRAIHKEERKRLYKLSKNSYKLLKAAHTNKKHFHLPIIMANSSFLWTFKLVNLTNSDNMEWNKYIDVDKYAAKNVTTLSIVIENSSRLPESYISLKLLFARAWDIAGTSWYVHQLFPLGQG